MYAIVDIAGQQFKVVKDQKVYVHRLDAKTGTKVSFDQVLLLNDGGKVTVGAPAIANASVEAKVVKHLKDDKVIVFKKSDVRGIVSKWTSTVTYRNRYRIHWYFCQEKSSTCCQS